MILFYQTRLLHVSSGPNMEQCPCMPDGGLPAPFLFIQLGCYPTLPQLAPLSPLMLSDRHGFLCPFMLSWLIPYSNPKDEVDGLLTAQWYNPSAIQELQKMWVRSPRKISGGGHGNTLHILP